VAEIEDGSLGRRKKKSGEKRKKRVFYKKCDIMADIFARHLSASS
jgi:hypothetical protein